MVFDATIAFEAGGELGCDDVRVVWLRDELAAIHADRSAPSNGFAALWINR